MIDTTDLRRLMEAAAEWDAPDAHHIDVEHEDVSAYIVAILNAAPELLDRLDDADEVKDDLLKRMAAMTKTTTRLVALRACVDQMRLNAEDEPHAVDVAEISASITQALDLLGGETAPTVVTKLRPEVLAFAHMMEAKLREHDDRPGWGNDKPEWLLMRLVEETVELQEALGSWRAELTRVPDYGSRGYRSSNPEGAARTAALEAVDVANFAMMIADLLGGES